MLDLIEPLRVTKNRYPDLLDGEGTRKFLLYRYLGRLYGTQVGLDLVRSTRTVHVNHKTSWLVLLAKKAKSERRPRQLSSSLASCHLRTLWSALLALCARHTSAH